MNAVHGKCARLFVSLRPLRIHAVKFKQDVQSDFYVCCANGLVYMCECVCVCLCECCASHRGGAGGGGGGRYGVS